MNATDLLETAMALALANLPVVLNVAASLAICVILGCRVAKMVMGATALSVWFQHAALAAGGFGAVLFSFSGNVHWAALSTSIGVLAFLLTSTRRWRFSAPPGTIRSDPAAYSRLRAALSRGNP